MHAHFFPVVDPLDDATALAQFIHSLYLCCAAVTDGAVICHSASAKVKQSPTLWPGLLVCIMETLVPEDASKTKDEVEGQNDNDEVCLCVCLFVCLHVHG